MIVDMVLITTGNDGSFSSNGYNGTGVHFPQQIPIVSYYLKVFKSNLNTFPFTLLYLVCSNDKQLAQSTRLTKAQPPATTHKM
jgi:hypothetical protein